MRRRHPLLGLAGGLVGLILQLLLVVLVLALLVLGTQTGLRTALAIAEDLAPGAIRVGQAQGRVLGRLHLGDVEIHVPDLDLRLASLDLDWSPLSALTGTLLIHRVAASDIDLVLAPVQEKSREPLTLPRVVLPLGVEIQEALVEGLRLSEPGAADPTLVLDRAALAARIQGSELRLTRLELDLAQPRLRARTQGQARLVDLYPLDLDLDWDLGLDPAVRLAGRGHIGGDLGLLVVEHRIQGSARLSLDIQVRDAIESPSWEGSIRLESIDLPDFSPTSPRITLTGRLDTKGDMNTATVAGTLDGKAPDLPDFGHLAANLDLLWQDRTLRLRALELDESVSGARFALTGDLDLKPADGRFVIGGAWERLRWPLSGTVRAESPQGRLEASGTLADYTYGLKAAAQGEGFPSLDLRLKGRGNRQGTHVDPLEIKALGGTLSALGDLAWAPGLTWDLRIRGQDLNPEALAQGLEDRIGLSLDTQGGLEGFEYDLAITTQGPGLPKARLTLDGRGDRRGTQIATLRLDTLGGQVEGQAKAAWDPRVTWDLDLQAADLNPGAWAKDWPGRIGGRVGSQGHLEADGPHLSARIEGLGGDLRGYPVAVDGALTMAGRAIRISGLTAASGPSRALVEGTLAGEDLDLSFDLASPDLASLLPQARGRFTAQGRLDGTRRAPRLRLDLSAEQAELAGQGIGQLSGKADLALTPDGRFDIRLDGRDLVAGGLRFDRLDLRGDGAMPNHRVSVQFAGPQLSAQVEASGSLTPQGTYRGSLARLDLDPAPLGTWRLQKPMPLTLAGERIAAGPLCLRDTKGSGGCLGFDQGAAGQWSADIDLDRLGFDLLAGVLPPSLVAEGAARLKGRFTAKGPLLTGQAVAQIPNGLVRVVRGTGQGEELDLSNTRLTLDANAKGLGAKLVLPIAGLATVDGSLSLPGWRLDEPARPGQPLQGAVKARVSGLTRLADLVPQLTGVKGAIDADLKLGGTLAAPRISGQAKASDLAAEVPLIGLKLSQLNLGLLADGERIDIQGQGDLGGGRLEISGDFRAGPSGLAGQLRAGGQRLRIADTKEYFALVSPSIEVRLGPRETLVRGEILVPEARIRPRSLPAGTVSASSDVVILDPAKAGEGTAGAAGGSPLDIDLQVKLGDDVTLDAFGVRGRLTGALRVLQAPGREMLGDGQLAIVDGLYRIAGGFGLAAEIGAPLTIEQGRLIFAKSPIANPGLLLQAQREGGDTSAGVRVRGTIRNPKLAFFSDSDPAMSQAEITKYLLTGVPPRQDSGTGDRSLSLGTYVAPKLFVEYESGLNDQKDRVKLRYDLTRRIELQTETGDNPGGDIFFKFEN